MTAGADSSSTVGIIAGSGVLPFSVADSLRTRGRSPFLFAIRGFCDPVRIAGYPHHWVALGQVAKARIAGVSLIAMLTAPRAPRAVLLGEQAATLLQRVEQVGSTDIGLVKICGEERANGHDGRKA